MENVAFGLHTDSSDVERRKVQVVDLGAVERRDGDAGSRRFVDLERYGLGRRRQGDGRQYSSADGSQKLVLHLHPPTWRGRRHTPPSTRVTRGGRGWLQPNAGITHEL
jgi:hypothetical protein